jgi:hypothetical protein
MALFCLIEDGFPDLSPIHDDWSSGYLAKKTLTQTHGEEISLWPTTEHHNSCFRCMGILFFAKKSLLLGTTGRGSETLHEHTFFCDVRRADLAC